MSVGLAYFGVFLLAPLTTLVTVVLVAGLILATIAALIGSGSWAASWRVVALPLAVLALMTRQRLVSAWRRVRTRALVDLDDLSRGSERADVGPKADGLRTLMRAGLPVLPGFVVTRHALKRLSEPALARALGDALAHLGSLSRPGVIAGRVVVRSSFVGEDGSATSGAGRYLTLRDVAMQPAAVLDAIARVFAHAGSAPGAVIVQPRVDGIFGVVASVDPRTGFTETALVQRHRLEDLGAETRESSLTVEVVSRLLGHVDPAVGALDSVLAALGPDAPPVEAEVLWPPGGETECPVFLQLRRLHGVDVVGTFVNGGSAALPPVPLSPPSQRHYLGELPEGPSLSAADVAQKLSSRLSQVVVPLGYRPYGPGDVREHAGRYYARHRLHDRPRGLGLIRYALALAGVRRQARDPVIRGAQAALLADAWWAIVLASAPELSEDDRRSLTAGAQPLGRPNTPEELLDPAYALDWPAWTPSQPGPIVVKGPIVRRLWVRFCLWRFRALLLARFESRERVLGDNRRLRQAMDPASLTGDGIARWRASCFVPAPSVLHEAAATRTSTSTHIPHSSTEERLSYGPAVRGSVVGILCFDDADAVFVNASGVQPHPNPDKRPLILYVADARPGYAVAFPRIAGLIVDRGGPLSHLVLLAREAGIPTIIGPRPAFPAGGLVSLDGGTGHLRLLKEPTS